MLVPLLALAPSYQIVDLGAPSGKEESAVEAVAINDRNEVLIQAGGAYLWRDGRFLALGEASYRSTMDEGSRVVPRAMNDRSIVVGDMGSLGAMFMSGLSDSYAFIWRGKAVEDLGAGFTSEVAGINNLGDVVGSVDHRAFARLRGKIVGLGVLSHIPAGNRSSAAAINGRRQILGTSTYGTKKGADDYYLPSRPFLLDGRVRPLRMRPVPLPAGYAEGIGYDLNDAGTILAVAYATGRMTPYLVRKGRIRLLDLPRETIIGKANLNERDDVVATLTSSSDPNATSPVLWRGGRRVEFPRFEGWELLTATGINDAGRICGVARHEGKTRAYMLIPG